MPKSYCYTVSMCVEWVEFLCVCQWGWVICMPAGWVLVVLLFCPGHTGSPYVGDSLYMALTCFHHTLWTAALEQDRPLMFNPVV